jgi:hypothetical protein
MHSNLCNYKLCSLVYIDGDLTAGKHTGIDISGQSRGWDTVKELASTQAC